MRLRAALLSVSMFIAAPVLASGPPPNKPDFRYLSRVLVVTVMVDPNLHTAGVKLVTRVQAALEDALEAGGIIVPRRGKDPPPETARVPWQTFLFHVQAATSPASPGFTALAYQAELVEYVPYPSKAHPPGPSQPVVLWREAAAQLVQVSTDAQLAQVIEPLAVGAASRCVKNIMYGRQQANPRH
jgi:hypothetical protein